MPRPKINIDGLFHALGDPKRRAILDRLCHGPLSVSRLAEPLGVTVTAVMQHLQILEESGLGTHGKSRENSHLPHRHSGLYGATAVD